MLGPNPVQETGLSAQHGRLRTALWKVAPFAIQRQWSRLEASPVGKRLLRGTFWSICGTMVSRALALVAAILAARIVGKVVYGELGIIQSTVGMFGTLAGFGMGTTAAKFVAELRGKDPAKAGRIIALSSVTSWTISIGLAGLLLVLSPWLCLHTLAAPELTNFLRLSAPLLVVSGINGAQLGVLSGFEAFKSIARVSAITGILNFPLVVGGALSFGLGGIVGGLILAQAGGCLLNLMALRKEARRYNIPISYASCMAELPVVWRFSIPAVFAEILISAVNWSTATMLVRQPNGYGEMGVFSAANQWFNAAMWLPFMVNSVVLPVLAERLGAEDKTNTAKLLKLSFKMNALVVIPLAAFGCLLSPLIMMSYGQGFRGEWPTLVAVLITASVLSLALPVGQLIAAADHMWLGFGLNTGWALVYFGATSLFLGWGWGAFGLASSRLVAYLAHAVFSLIYAVIFLLSIKKAPGLDKSQSLRAVTLGETDVIS